MVTRGCWLVAAHLIEGGRKGGRKRKVQRRRIGDGAKKKGTRWKEDTNCKVIVMAHHWSERGGAPVVAGAACAG